MTVLALLLAVLAVLVVGTIILLGAHWFSVQIAKSLERLIEID
jgi:membrane-associated phospholipid phosphatase